MMTKEEHPQLEALLTLWNFPRDVLNKVLWGFHNDFEPEATIGYASDYVDFMDAIACTNNPAEAWAEWAESKGVFGDDNPFI